MHRRLTIETRDAVTPLLLLALQGAQVGLAVKDGAGSFLYLNGLPEYFPQLDPPKAKDEELFGEDWLPLMAEAQAEVLESGTEKSIELSRTSNNRYQICECTVMSYQIAGSPPAIVMTFKDLTAERKREDTLKALLRELSHRTKNLLAIIQSVALQTARNSGDLDTFLDKFRGRVAALSSAQDIVTDSNWRGAGFRELARRQFAKYVEDGKDPRVAIEGTDCFLSPNGATHIGLALHELITNSVSFGALSQSDGDIQVVCEQMNSGDGSKIRIVWNERIPNGAGRERNGSARHFGSTVLERVVPAAIDGDANYEIKPEQVVYNLVFASDQ